MFPNSSRKTGQLKAGGSVAPGSSRRKQTTFPAGTTSLKPRRRPKGRSALQAGKVTRANVITHIDLCAKRLAISVLAWHGLPPNVLAFVRLRGLTYLGHGSEEMEVARQIERLG
jgi:hypothetical protein